MTSRIAYANDIGFQFWKDGQLVWEQPGEEFYDEENEEEIERNKEANKWAFDISERTMIAIAKSVGIYQRDLGFDMFYHLYSDKDDEEYGPRMRFQLRVDNSLYFMSIDELKTKIKNLMYFGFYENYGKKLFLTLPKEELISLIHSIEKTKSTRVESAIIIQRACYNWLWNPEYVNPITGNKCIHLELGFKLCK